MPVYVFQAPDGKRYKVEAPTPEAAQQGFTHLVTTSPGMFARPGVRAALKDIESTPLKSDTFGDMTHRLADAATFGLSTQFNAGLGAAGTAIRNRIPGAEAGYSAKDYYDASRLAQAAQRAKTQAEHPLLSAATDVAGAFAMPGAEAVGKFIVGKTAPALKAAGERIPMTLRALQTGRAAGVGALQGATQGAALAAPGEEAESAKRGAAIGAVAAPVVGAGLAVAGKAAPAIGRTAQRVVGPYVSKLPGLTETARAALQPPPPIATSAEKLGSILRREGLKPEAVTQALDEWTAAGGVTPNLIDILKEAGAAPGVLRLLQRSGAQAPARVAAETYAEKTVGGVQKKALEEVGKLPVAETRTPSQIRADLEAKRAAIGAEEGEGEPVAPTEGGQGVHAKLNAMYDKRASEVDDLYGAARKTGDAYLPREDSSAISDAVRQSITEAGYDPAVFEELKGISKVVGNLSDARTVEDLYKRRQQLTMLQRKGSNDFVKGAAGVAKSKLDDEIYTRNDQGAFTDAKGNPDAEPVMAWKTAIDARRQFGADFEGNDIVHRLTERKFISGEEQPALDPASTTAHIFGSGSKLIVKPNAVRDLMLLRDRLGADSPEWERLRQEAAQRVLGDDPAKAAERLAQFESTAPPDLVQMLVAPTERDRATTLQAELGGVDEQTKALELGEKALTTPSEEYAPALGGVGENAPLTAAGAKQAALDYLESPAPESTSRLRRLSSEQASKNLGATLGEDEIGALQARLRNLEKQARNAQQIEVATGASGPHESPLVETISAGDLAYPRRGAADTLLRLARFGTRLSPQEYEATIQQLTSEAPDTVDAILKHLTEKYSGAHRAASPYAAMLLGNRSGNADAMERLRQEYGLDY